MNCVDGTLRDHVALRETLRAYDRRPELKPQLLRALQFILFVSSIKGRAGELPCEAHGSV